MIKNFIIGFTISGLVSYILACLTYIAFNNVSKLNWIYILLLSIGCSTIAINVL